MQEIMTYGFEYMIQSLLAGMCLTMPFYLTTKLEK